MRIIEEEELKEILFLLKTRQTLKAKQKLFNLKKIEDTKENEKKDEKKEEPGK